MAICKEMPMEVPKDLVEKLLAYLGKQPCQQVFAMYTQLATLLYQAEQPKIPEVKAPEIKE